MATPLSVYLFGDQITQFRDDLGALLLVRSNPILNSFLDQAALELRREIQSLSRSQRDRFPSFCNFLDLLAIDSSKPLHPALQLALSTVHHFSIFLCQKTIELERLRSADVSYTFGFGTGLLAAAAVTCCPTLDQLPPVALETTLISFRIGLLAANTRDQIEVGKTKLASWRAKIEINNTESVVHQLEEFSNQKRLSTWSKPYACGVSHDSVLISGAPTLLGEFVDNYNLSANNLPVFAPFHSSHIFSDNDVERIVQSFSPTLVNVTSKLRLLSHLDGKVTPPQTLQSLLMIAVKAVLRENVASDDFLPYIKDTMQSQVAQTCTIISIGTSSGLKLAGMIQDSDISTDEVSYMDSGTIVKCVSGSQHASQPKIAIIGFSGRFPEAENIQSFWDILHGGVDTHSEIPKSRWDVGTHVDSTLKRKNTSGTPWGCWLKNPGLFDRTFFSISPREAPQMDPAQRLALMCAYEAVEMAGIVPDTTPSTARSRVGVFIGSTSNDWCETNSAQDVDFYFIPGGNRAFIPGRINYCFKLSGPSFSIDTACSSSLAATHLACNALWRHDIDTAIVGGTNILTNPDVTAGLDRGHFLSRTGNCKTFDDGADGYCRGEGVGVVVLKRLEDAQAENDPIHGCILSAVTNHSAEAESITRPHVEAQQALFSQVLAKAGVHPNDVSYVEMHGTGTQAGDSREMASVSATFAPWPHDPRSRPNDLHVGSVKANVGHGESVAGVTALIKVLLMMQKNEIPPHCGIKTKINQAFPPDLEERCVKIAKQPTLWTRTDKPRRVVLNNFSAAGGNSCILVEDGPIQAIGSKRPRRDKRLAHVITMSAKSQRALEANIRSMAQFLLNSNAVSLPDLAYTTTARRAHYSFRSSYVAPTVQDLSKSLEHDTIHPPEQSRGPPKIIIVFSGQGSNHTGMGKYLYDTNTTFKMDLDRFDAIAQAQGFDSFLPYLRGIEEATCVASPLTVQLAHVSLQMALARLWESWGIVPAAVIGHSLGEYAALNCAGVLSEFDVLWICGQRVKLLDAHCQVGTHAMLAVRSPQYEVAANLDDIAIDIACINSLRETVISGANEDLDLAAQRLESKGIKCSRVKVPYAFHSGQMQPIMDDFAKVLDGVSLKTPTIPVLSPLLSTVIKAGDEIDKHYLLRQCREPVNIVGAIWAAEAASILDDRTHLLETGPSLVLARLMQRTMENPSKIIPSLEPNQDSWLVLSHSVAAAYRVGCNIDWAQYHRDYDHAVVQAPSYSWDLKNYWIQYVHDWSLRKGEPLPAIAASAVSRLEMDSTCCQKVITADFAGDTVHAVVEADLQFKDLKPVVSGHKVNGIAVCVGAVYADMAVSCAKSILKCFQDDTTNTAILIMNMDMQEALVINDSPEPQVVRIEANGSWQQKKVDVEISSADSKGQMRKIHATATVTFGHRQHEQQNLRRSMASTESQIESLKSTASSGLTERFTTSMAYRMVASLAQYDTSHKGVKEVHLNSTSLEACGLVSSAKNERLLGDFTVHPCVFDSILQLATFVLNANDNSRFDQEVYVIRGWEKVFLDDILTPDKEYETYVKMTARDEDVYVGDIAIMEGSTLIGYIKGVRVQRIPRRLMDVMFRPKTDMTTTHTSLNETLTVKSEIKEALTADKVSSNSSKLNAALAIIAEESCISINDLEDQNLLCDIGIDSLLILVIASRFREELQMDLNPSFFMEVNSIGALKAYFNDQALPPSVDSALEDSANSSDTATSRTQDASNVSDESETDSANLSSKEQCVDSRKAPMSTSIILQGTLNAKTKTMFLFPDGSGSATSYMHLPRIHKDVAVVAMNCPYMTNPQDMQGSFEDITRILVAEVRRRQPKGPYYLGGWSAGGAFAHLAVRMLIEAGEKVRSLVLIDAPCPIGLGKLPQAFFDYWRKIHQPGEMVGDRPLPSWLMDHFKAVNENLRRYTANPLPRGHCPKTYLAWAAKGTDNLAAFPGRHLLTPEESADLGFLMDDKTDFGTRGWEKLVEGKIRIEKAMTSNHFTITRGEGAKLVSGLIKKACFDSD